jgi:hypothetical protein
MLVASTPTLLLAALLLVLVASLPAGSGVRFRTSGLVYVLALLGAVALLGWLIDKSGLEPGTSTSSVRKYAAGELKQATQSNLLVVDGGSYVVNGVDTHVLVDELRKLGYSADAVKLAVGAGNHFERYRLNEEVREALQDAERPGRQLIYLAEIHSSYDRLPLAQFDKNQESYRVYHYTTLQNSWFAARALASPGVEEPLDGAWQWPLLRHTMVSVFNVGAVGRLVPDREIEPGTGRSIDKHPPFRKFKGLRPLLKQLREEAKPSPPLPWLVDIRERRLMRLWQPHLSRFVYFGLPSTRAGQLAYVREFCASVKHPCIAPADESLIRELDAKPHWRNAGHMRASGAEIYSRWLAQELHRRELVRK